MSYIACETMRMEDKQARLVQEDDEQGQPQRLLGQKSDLSHIRWTENTTRLTGSPNLKTNQAAEPMNGRTDLFQVGNLHLGPTREIVKYRTQAHVHGCRCFFSRLTKTCDSKGITIKATAEHTMHSQGEFTNVQAKHIHADETHHSMIDVVHLLSHPTCQLMIALQMDN